MVWRVRMAPHTSPVLLVAINRGESVKGNLKIHLKPRERIYVNGALISVDRRVTLELLNEMCFLLESHVLAHGDAKTPLRQIYFIVQSLLIEPQARGVALQLYQAQHREVLATCADIDLLEGLVEVRAMIEQNRFYEALKRLRSLFDVEDRYLAARSNASALSGAA